MNFILQSDVLPTGERLEVIRDQCGCLPYNPSVVQLNVQPSDCCRARLHFNQQAGGKREDIEGRPRSHLHEEVDRIFQQIFYFEKELTYVDLFLPISGLDQKVVLVTSLSSAHQSVSPPVGTDEKSLLIAYGAQSWLRSTLQLAVTALAAKGSENPASHGSAEAKSSALEENIVRRVVSPFIACLHVFGNRTQLVPNEVLTYQ